jgi:hypothetical protein
MGKPFHKQGRRGQLAEARKKEAPAKGGSPSSALRRLERGALNLVAFCLRHGEEALTLASVLALAVVSGCFACAPAFASIRADTVAFAFFGGVGHWRYSTRENQRRGGSSNGSTTSSGCLHGELLL